MENARTSLASSSAAARRWCRAIQAADDARESCTSIPLPVLLETRSRRSASKRTPSSRPRREARVDCACRVFPLDSESPQRSDAVFEAAYAVEAADGPTELVTRAASPGHPVREISRLYVESA